MIKHHICYFKKFDVSVIDSLMLTSFGLSIVFIFFILKIKHKSARLKSLEKKLASISLCLEQITEEKDMLTKEMHHRSKNTIQIVMSLLNIQASHYNHPEAVEAVKNIQQKIFAISLVHQHMYQSERITAIAMEAFIPALVAYLKDSLDPQDKITCNLEIMPLNLDINRAIPIGLIINEAVSNVFKYAFPDNREGILTLKLNSDNGKLNVITVSDEGVGMGYKHHYSANTSFGKILMAGLADQLDGQCKIESNGGVKVIISFNSDE